MKQNRKFKKSHSATATRTFQVGGVVLVVFIMTIFNIMAESKCKQIKSTIGKDKKELGRLEEAYLRECAKWEELTTPENLDRALLRHGLNMRYPKAEQIVKMDASGVPVPGQLSIAFAKNRANRTMKVARKR